MEEIIIKPDEFAKFDYKIAIEVEKLMPMPPECDCWICKEKGNHFPAKQ